MELDIAELQRITLNNRIDEMYRRAAQAWQDNQQGAVIPIWLDTEFNECFRGFITDAIEQNTFWDVWDHLQQT